MNPVSGASQHDTCSPTHDQLRRKNTVHLHHPVTMNGLSFTFFHKILFICLNICSQRCQVEQWSLSLATPSWAMIGLAPTEFMTLWLPNLTVSIGCVVEEGRVEAGIIFTGWMAYLLFLIEKKWGRQVLVWVQSKLSEKNKPSTMNWTDGLYTSSPSFKDETKVCFID